MLIKAVIAFLYLPGVIAFLVPVIIAIYDPWRSSFISIGVLVIINGLLVLIWCVRDFYISGRGTLAPWEPPKKLIVIGLYRFVRNPMYIGVLILVLGWSILFSSPLLVLYMFILAISFHIRTVKYEEPYLKEQFKDEWELYRRKVPRWFPKIDFWTNQ
ncbi:isoprenylcysteine carboxyl methyltransferase [Alkalibaculum sp. M08DMB]|uniref:Isoprenylcysteine carboxyl methyltransferase n=1 Tax=Alkalibaculum sporogenes TaxID=2655001 RepID=A0A6A7K4H4_9FIRM|nr:isoprenylcysteine carboxylmethyltransferase family protein [Alkalibaculum sporogenes]MPW24275.1 isoprenylcysteine carboxyl methyltransferase [Alkalibaculum sporogenes]